MISAVVSGGTSVMVRRSDDSRVRAWQRVALSEMANASSAFVVDKPNKNFVLMVQQTGRSWA